MKDINGTASVKRLAIVPVLVIGGALAGSCIRSGAGQQQTTPPIKPPAQVLDIQSAFEQVAEKLKPSVVYIQSRITPKSGFQQGMDSSGDPFGGMPPDLRQFFGGPGGGPQFRSAPSPMYPRHALASGSGVIVRSDGYILTNDHVVENADRVTVRLSDGREFVGKVIRDARSDLALIKIPANGLAAAEMADSDRAKTGQWALAFGSPFGLSDSMTVGVVSALHRQQSIGGGADGRFYNGLIQTDASINPGNSGGPLVDIYGRVVGINVAIESPSGGSVGIGFAIPANTARYVVDQLISKGAVTRGFLGLAPKTLSYDEQQRYHVSQGVLVTSVEEGTPASRAGFQVEDIITRFNGQAVKDDIAFRDMVARTSPGTRADVVVRRSGHDQNLTVTVGAPQTETASAVPASESAAAASRGKLGVELADVSRADLRDQFKIPADVTSGALIGQVLPGSPAAEAGLMPGDILVRLNGQPVANAARAAEIIRNLKGTDIPMVFRRGKQTILGNISVD